MITMPAEMGTLIIEPMTSQQAEEQPRYNLRSQSRATRKRDYKAEQRGKLGHTPRHEKRERRHEQRRARQLCRKGLASRKVEATRSSRKYTKTRREVDDDLESVTTCFTSENESEGEELSTSSAGPEKMSTEMSKAGGKLWSCTKMDAECLKAGLSIVRHTGKEKQMVMKQEACAAASAGSTSSAASEEADEAVAASASSASASSPDPREDGHHLDAELWNPCTDAQPNVASERTDAEFDSLARCRTRAQCAAVASDRTDAEFLEDAVREITERRRTAEAAMQVAWTEYDSLARCTDEEAGRAISRMKQSASQALTDINEACRRLRGRAKDALDLQSTTGRQRATTTLSRLLSGVEETQREVALLQPLRQACPQELQRQARERAVAEGIRTRAPVVSAETAVPAAAPATLPRRSASRPLARSATPARTLAPLRSVSRTPARSATPARSPSRSLLSPEHRRAMSPGKPWMKFLGWDMDMPCTTSGQNSETEILMARLRATGLIQRVQDPSVVINLMLAQANADEFGNRACSASKDRKGKRRTASRSEQRNKPRKLIKLCCHTHNQPCVIRYARDKSRRTGMPKARAFFCCPFSKFNGGCGFQKWVKSQGKRGPGIRSATRSQSRG